MDKEISKDLFEVENPVYQNFDEIMKKYYGYIIVMTNEESDDNGKVIGGKVRYYTKTSRDYMKKWGEVIHVPENGECRFFSFVPRPNSLGGLFL